MKYFKYCFLGVTFDAASQCHLQFGAEAVVCAKPTELCEHLWCLVNNTCKTMLRPAAPGTTCGENMVNNIYINRNSYLAIYKKTSSKIVP